MTDIKTGVKTPFVVRGNEARCCNPLPPFFMRAPNPLLTLELSAFDIYNAVRKSNLFLIPDNQDDYTPRITFSPKGTVHLIIEQKTQRGDFNE